MVPTAFVVGTINRINQYHATDHPFELGTMTLSSDKSVNLPFGNCVVHSRIRLILLRASASSAAKCRVEVRESRYRCLLLRISS